MAHPAEVAVVLQVVVQVALVAPVALQKAVAHPVEVVLQKGAVALQVEAAHQNAADLLEVRKSAVAHADDSQICVDLVSSNFDCVFTEL